MLNSESSPKKFALTEKMFLKFATKCYQPIGREVRKLLKRWWTWPGSNRRPLPCHGSALPAAPQARFLEALRTVRFADDLSILADLAQIVNAREYGGNLGCGHFEIHNSPLPNSEKDFFRAFHRALLP